MPPPRSIPLVLATLAMALAGCTDHGAHDDVVDQRREVAYDAAIDAGLDEAVAEFLGLAALGATATYQATLVGIDDAGEVVITSRPPDVRIDVVVGGRVVATQAVVNGTAHACLPTEDDDDQTGDLTCTEAISRPIAPTALSPQAMAELTNSLAQRRDDYDFAVGAESVADTEATCLTTTVRPGRERPGLGEAGTMCVSMDGAMLRLERDGSSIEATSYTSVVTDDAFEIPG